VKAVARAGAVIDEAVHPVVGFNAEQT
jgi:hypothetical protein